MILNTLLLKNVLYFKKWIPSSNNFLMELADSQYSTKYGAVRRKRRSGKFCTAMQQSTNLICVHFVGGLQCFATMAQYQPWLLRKLAILTYWIRQFSVRNIGCILQMTNSILTNAVVSDSFLNYLKLIFKLFLELALMPPLLLL